MKDVEHIIERDDSYEQRRGWRYPPIDAPVAKDQTMVRCIHARVSMGMIGNDFPDGKFRAITALWVDGDGIYQTYDAASCRVQAEAFIKMAEFLEENRGEELVEKHTPKKAKKPFSIMDLIRKSGGETLNLDDLVPPDPNVRHQVIWQLSPWARRHNMNYDSLGHIPSFLHTDDERSAKDQIDANYQHGGGWRPSPGPWTIGQNGVLRSDDEKYNLVATAYLRDEEVQLYESAWTAIVQPDGSSEVARLD